MIAAVVFDISPVAESFDFDLSPKIERVLFLSTCLFDKLQVWTGRKVQDPLDKNRKC